MTTMHMRQASSGSKARRAGPRRADATRERRLAGGLAALLDTLDQVTREASLESDQAAALGPVCEFCVRLVPAAACGLYVKEVHQAGLRLAACSAAAFRLPPACPPEFVRAAARDGIAAHDAMSALAVPVAAGACRVGLLVVVDHRGRRFASDDVAFASRVAQVAGLALRARGLHDLAAGRLRPEVLMWETLDPTGAADPARTLAQARRLGHDLVTPHVVIVGKAAADTAAERLHRGILRAIPHGLTDLLGTTVVAIVPAGRLPVAVTGGLSVGVSRPCADLGRYPAAYREAQEAVDIGAKLFGPGRVTHIDDLDGYRFIPAFIKGGLTDVVEYQMMSRLPDDLLKTLEIYLDSGGNATRAARQLFLHRNTLRQRLDRIAALLSVDLTTSERWLSLQLSVKAARLARLAPAPELGAGDGASAIPRAVEGASPAVT